VMFYDLKATSVCNGEVCYSVDNPTAATFPQVASIPRAVPSVPPPSVPKDSPPWWWDVVVQTFWAVYPPGGGSSQGGRHAPVPRMMPPRKGLPPGSQDPRPPGSNGQYPPALPPPTNGRYP